MGPPLLLSLLLLLAPGLAPPSSLLGAGAWRGAHAAVVLRGVRVEAPRSVVRGRPFALHCLLLAAGASGSADGAPTIYSLKWYKDLQEFFRFTPKRDDAPHRGHNQLQVFHADGVDLDLSASNATHLHIRAASLATSGNYTCEVTEDAPLFRVHIDLAEVSVFDIDRKADLPQLEGVSGRYKAGGELNAVCRGPWSRPATRLHIQLNGHLANASALVRPLPLSERSDGLLRPAVQLRARAFPGADGRLRVKCVAELLDFVRSVESTAMVGERSVQLSGQPTLQDGDINTYFPQPTAADGAPDAVPQLSPLLLLLLPALVLLRAGAGSG